jgi:hypothetical protein
MSLLRRELPVTAKVIDAGGGLVEYVASDESMDCYREVIRVSGWRFTRFQKNAPFVDSHRYDSVECLLGKVVDFQVKGRQLVETVQWAIDVPSNQRARIGWEMTRAGYLKAVSVGFQPTRMTSKWDSDKTLWLAQLKELGLHEEDGVRAIYVEQEQLELSAVVIGANPNALLNVGKAFKAGVLNDADLQFLSGEFARRETPASSAPSPAPADAEAHAQARQRFLERIQQITKKT